MRILKYIFLLLLLFVLALSVYVSTQNGKFTIEKSRVIQLDKSTLFQYVNDFQNWKEFYGWKDSNTATEISKNPADSTFFFKWKSNSDEGFINRLSSNQKDSISQKIHWNKINSDAFLTVKDTSNGTKISWKVSGELNFIDKISSIFSNKIENEIGSKLEKTLENLDKLLTVEIKKYSIDIEGITAVNQKNYLKRNAESTSTDFYTVLQKELPLLVNFTKENSISSFGHPFVVHEKYQNNASKTKFSVALPLREIIFTAPDSEFVTDSILPHQALKIVLKGDYSHSEKAWKKGFEHLKNNNLEEDKSGTYREVYVKNRLDSNYPSEWITEIYIPVKSSN